MSGNRGFAPIFAVIALGLLMIVAGGAYYMGTHKSKPQQNVPITTPSPISSSSISIDTASWTTYTDINKGYSLKYPEKQIVPDETGNATVSFCPDDEYYGIRCKLYPEKLSAYFSNHSLLVPDRKSVV